MKKLLILFIIILITISSFVFKYEFKNKKQQTPYYNWQKIEGGVYLDINSFEVIDNYKIGTFKIDENHNFFSNEDDKSGYKIIRYKANCNNSNKLAVLNENNNENNPIFKHYKDIQDGKLIYETLCMVRKYKKEDTISFYDFLYSEKNQKDIKINKNDEIIYKGKVVLSNSFKNKPLTNQTAMTTVEMITRMNAHGITPKKGCNQADTLKSGTMGCYMQFSEGR